RIDEYGYQRTITTTFIYGETPRTAESDRFLRCPVVYAKTVFDYDFRAAQRLIATGRLAVYSTAIVAIAPLFVVNLAAELLTFGTRLLADG
ncbi:hypothetical protein L6232_24090, partial [Shewanella sp. C31]|nr:hypothetical protein [Shewanella electrica]